MAVKKYKYNSKTQLSKHFNAQEFRCKCGCKRDILIDTDLIDTLENLMFILGAEHCNITSGYRCPKHDKEVGGKGNGSHTLGYASDNRFKDKKGKYLKSSVVAIALEDLGHKKGIGYQCGHSKDSTGAIHIDTRPRKWYADEGPKPYKEGIKSFHTYLKVAKTPKYEFELLKDKYFRKQPKVKATNKISKIKKGVKFKSVDNKIYLDSKKNKWILTKLNNKSGYICVDDRTGVQAKKVN